MVSLCHDEEVIQFYENLMVLVTSPSAAAWFEVQAEFKRHGPKGCKGVMVLFQANTNTSLVTNIQKITSAFIADRRPIQS